MTFTKSDFELSNLSALDTTDVEQLIQTLVTQLQELNPSLDLKRGVFKDVVLYYHAVLEAAIRTNLERYQSARSLQKINADPTLADDSVVNEVLSNFNVTRRAGTKARGPVTIELSSLSSVTVPVNSVFEANGNQYLATDTFIARTNSSQVATANDRLISSLSNGNYAFTVDVEAAENGIDYKLDSGDLVLPNRSLANFVTAYATATFEEGVNAETNAELLATLQQGISAKTVSNRNNMKAWVKSLTGYSGVTSQAIVGYGDPEMLRDSHTIFPISYGGRVDWYVRTQPSIQVINYTVTATLMSRTSLTSTWQFSLDQDAFPGFYEVRQVRRETDSVVEPGFAVTLDTRGTSLPSSGFYPDIANPLESQFSAFQTAVIQFEDTATDTSSLPIGSTATYVAEIAGLPLIKDLQTKVSSRDFRSYAADALIKAPLPCFLSITLTVNKNTNQADPDVNAMKAAIVSEINSIGFIGRVDGSRIIEIVHRFLTDDTSVSKLDLFGRILAPGQALPKYLRSSDSLVIPEEYDKMLSAKTVQFFAETSSISVNIESSIPVHS